MNTRDREPPDGFDRIPELFWRRAAQAPHRLLMLDYDGTLAPFQVERQKAVPLPGSLAVLGLIAACRATTVAIVSGRPLAELEEFVVLPGVTLVGEHGFEERTADGERVAVPVSESTQEALGRAADAAHAIGFGDRVERKRSSIVLHTRGLPPAQAAEVEAGVREIWREEVAGGYRLDRTSGGLELRAPGRDKGEAVSDLIERAPEGAFPVYLGDDQTDEDAFAAVRARGFGIKIGTAPTLARGQLASCDQVPDFLRHWLIRVEGVRQPQ